jgi:hypothetical protein
LFDLQGNAVSIDEVAQLEPNLNLEEAMRETHGEGIQLPRIDFSGETYSTGPIDEYEVAKVLFHLKLIETGQFVAYKRSSSS